MKKKHWFKRKTYGWGWQPATKEGWIVTIFFMVAVIANFTIGLDTGESLPADRLFIFGLLVAFLLLITYKTGEKPRWQWGKRK